MATPSTPTTSTPSTPAAAGATGQSPLVPAGERVILSTRPSVLFVPLWPLGSLAVVLVASIGGAWLLQKLAEGVGRGDRKLNASLHEWAAWLAMAGVAAILLRLLWQVLEWRFRSYVLTDRRIIRTAGVLRQHSADIPLRNVQHLTLYRSLRERLAGLGTIGINTSGTGQTEAYWVMLADPKGVLATLRAAVDEAQRAGDGTGHAAGQRPFVIGVAGGIGSGKSAVAEELAKRGAVVIDSDRESKAALARPEVRDRLVEWWGPSMLSPEGGVDRQAVARVVFADPVQRERLESLIHPLIKASRQEQIARARARGAAFVVIDAPLLYEAGVDRECDRVIFVDAPLAQRIQRVASTRGWSESDLVAREKVQVPLEEKRRRADDIIVNDADREALARRVGDLLEHIRRNVISDSRAHAPPNR